MILFFALILLVLDFRRIVLDRVSAIFSYRILPTLRFLLSWSLWEAFGRQPSLLFSCFSLLATFGVGPYFWLSIAFLGMRAASYLYLMRLYYLHLLHGLRLFLVSLTLFHCLALALGVHFSYGCNFFSFRMQMWTLFHILLSSLLLS